MTLPTEMKPFIRGLRDAALIIAVIVAALYANEKVREIPADDIAPTMTLTAQK